ncbi:MAG: hypothetical protein AB7V27_13620 [Candidatus Binatia bacterium]
MAVLNHLDRSISGDVIDPLAQLGLRAAYVKQWLPDKLIEYRQYVEWYGTISKKSARGDGRRSSGVAPRLPTRAEQSRSADCVRACAARQRHVAALNPACGFVNIPQCRSTPEASRPIASCAMAAPSIFAPYARMTKSASGITSNI